MNSQLKFNLSTLLTLTGLVKVKHVNYLVVYTKWNIARITFHSVNKNLILLNERKQSFCLLTFIKEKHWEMEFKDKLPKSWPNVYSKIDASWKLGSTCKSVWPSVSCTCIDLHSINLYASWHKFLTIWPPNPSQCKLSGIHCVVPENIHTPPKRKFQISTL